MSDYRWSDPPIGEPAPTGGGGSGEAIEALGYFSASDTTAFDGTSYRVPLDTNDGATPGFFTLGGTPDWTITLSQDAVYQATAVLRVTGCTQGDEFTGNIEAASSYLGDMPSTATADENGICEFAVHTAADWMQASTGSLSLSVAQIGGTGTTPNLQTARMVVTKHAGAGPAVA